MRLEVLRKYSRTLAIGLLIPFLVTIVPVQSFAITSGPAQEEFATFSPAQATDMVDLYSGDFKYNIPLMNVPGPNGGYPINLFYTSGTNIEETGSWVGYGWNLTVGAINRQMRGVPDDFSGKEQIVQEKHLKPSFSISAGTSIEAALELAGINILGGNNSLSLGSKKEIYYNNYTGLGLRMGPDIGFNTGIVDLGVGLSFDSQEGIGIDPSLRFGKPLDSEFKKSDSGLLLNASYNNRKGVQAATVQTQLKYRTTKSGKAAVGTANYSFGIGGMVPETTIPTQTTSIDLDIKSIPEIFPYLAGSISAGKNAKVEWTKLRNDGKLSSSAFGYLHTEKAGNPKDMKDFNRGSLPYSKKVPNLAPSFYTYDMLSVSGEGVGGMVRPYRSKPDILSLPAQKNKETGHRANVEVGPGNIVHVGVGYNLAKSEVYSGPWKNQDADISDVIEKPCSTCVNEAKHQVSYYKFLGEQSGVVPAEDGDQLTAWGNEQPARPKLEKDNKKWKATGEFENTQGGPIAGLNTGATYFDHVPHRLPQANTLQTLNAQQAEGYGFSKDLVFYNYPPNLDNPVNKFAPPFRDNSEKISEMIVTKSDGMRYIYGLPAMNNLQTDATFNVYSTNGYQNPYGGSNLFSNSPNVDVIKESKHTTNASSNQYSSKNTIPKYAHSWLLTHIVSPDYSDTDNNGFSNNDPGSWMTFEYQKVANNYRWREPYLGAAFMQGMRSDVKDDMASYTYGEKELHYLYKIETPTHRAIFEISPREDAAGVADPNDPDYPEGVHGGMDFSDGNKMFKLDKIKLYAKSPNGVVADDYLLQTIVFEYAKYTQGQLWEELCVGIPSAPAGRGKLTLKRVYTLMDNSSKGQFSPYEFTYADNPDYHRLNKDRWGNYQNNTGASVYGNQFSFVEFPYTDQRYDNSPNATTQIQDEYATAWQLSEIKLPTGGVIKVAYESDDYAYEMDKPAAQMFDIIGTQSSAPTTVINTRYVNGLVQAPLNDETGDDFRIYIRLPRAIPTGVNTKDYFKKYYLGNLKKVYFKVLCQLREGTGPASERDYVAGYAEIVDPETNSDSYGVEAGGQTAFFTLKNVPSQKHSYGVKIHPFRRAALEHLRMNRPSLAFPAYSQGEVPPNKILKQIGGILGNIYSVIPEMLGTLAGYTNWAVLQGFSQQIYLNGNSMVRLQAGSGFMYGGGNRVKSITMNSGWTSGATSDLVDTYGQLFDYTIEENERTISSGVAITPQGVGGDECALLEPVDYDQSTFMVSPFHLFVEKPVMRAYYPGASVGYRKVTVSSYANKLNDADDPQVSINKGLAPITVHEFYTHKDFPVFESQTGLSSAAPAYKLKWFLIGGELEKNIGRSQGYTVELNNMAGMQKSVTKRTNPLGTQISKVEYVYNTEGDYDEASANKLSSNVSIVKNTNGSLALVEGKIGETHDIFYDFHENAYTSKTMSGGDLNFDFGVAGIFPLGGVSIIPVYNKTSTSLRTAVTHKIIYRTGILKEVRATDGESTIVTSNIAFDKTTAQPILTKVTNEFKDNIYNLSQPAHWYYDGMGGAYQNLGIKVDANGAITNGIVDLPTGTANLFTPGDEIWVDNNSGTDMKAYVMAVNTTSNTLECLLEDGNPLEMGAGDKTLTVTRSGHRNQLTAAAGGLKYLAPNGTDDVVAFNDRNLRVLDASATTFKDDWLASYCNNYWQEADCSSPNQLASDLMGLWSNHINSLSGTSNFPLSIRQAVCPNNPNPTYFQYFSFIELGDATELVMKFIGSNSSPYNSDCSCEVILKAPPASFIGWAGITDVQNLQVGTTPYQFSVDVSTDNGNTFTTVTSIRNDCFAMANCDPSGYAQECNPTFDENPYVTGEKGNWRQHETFAYKAKRAYDSQSLLREYGIYDNFTPFDWYVALTTNLQNGWVRANSVTKYSPHGNVLEEYDALGNYSAAQFGHQKQLATAVCNNSRYQEMGYDGFEDYDKFCTDHFKFSISFPHGVTDALSHTGLRCLDVKEGAVPPIMIKNVAADASALDQQTCLGTFVPIAGKKYVVSAWVKERDAAGNDLRKVFNYDNSSIRVNISGATQAEFNFAPSGEIVDGWQRIFGEFEIPSLTSTSNAYVEVRLINNGEDNCQVFFDDVRIHPFNSNMKSFVYNPLNLRLMATLDENNFATYYIRNQEGQVVKYNVETEKGIITVKEGAMHVVPWAGF